MTQLHALYGGIAVATQTHRLIFMPDQKNAADHSVAPVAGRRANPYFALVLAGIAILPALFVLFGGGTHR